MTLLILLAIWLLWELTSFLPSEYSLFKEETRCK